MSTLSITNSFVAGTVISPSQMNTNFTDIRTWANGNIDDTNILASGISFTKLNKTSQLLVLRTAGTLTVGSGTTGDTEPRVTFTSDGGIKFGPGSASVVDILLKRLDANTLAVRNAGDSSDETLRLGALKLRNSNVLTITPASMAADRAITAVDPGASASLRFTTGTFNAGGAVVTDGTNLISTAAGVAGQVLTSNGSSAPTWQDAAGGGGIVQNVRLYGSTGDPTGDAGTALTTVYVGPYGGNSIALYDGSDFVMQTFSQVSVSVPSTTDTMYSVYASSASATSITATAVAWTNDTTPGATNALTLINGQYVRNTDNTQLFIGVFRTTGVSGQTQDNTARRYIVSYLNPLPAALSCTDATASWTYSSTTIRSANNDTTDGTGQVSFILPNAGRFRISAVNITILKSSTGFTMSSGIGLDSTSAYSGFCSGANTGGGVPDSQTSLYTGYPGSGRHYLARLEASGGTTGTWYGTTSSIDASGVPAQSGMIVEAWK